MGEGCERLTIFMQSRVPLGPGKFHVVVLVIIIIIKITISSLVIGIKKVLFSTNSLAKLLSDIYLIRRFVV